MAKKMYGLNVSFGDELLAQMLKTIIDYEAARRGLSRGQALTALVLEAADVDSYPPEVRERLDKIAERTRKRAAADALSVA